MSYQNPVGEGSARPLLPQAKEDGDGRGRAAPLPWQTPSVPAAVTLVTALAMLFVGGSMGMLIGTHWAAQRTPLTPMDATFIPRCGEALYAQDEYLHDSGGPCIIDGNWPFMLPTFNGTGAALSRIADEVLESATRSTAPGSEGQCVATIYIIRHCEKKGEIRKCNAMGRKRAKFIGKLFADPGGSFLVPSEIFARAPEPKKFVLREIETVQPLADKLGLPIQQFPVHEKKIMAKQLLQEVGRGELCGKAAIISWKHENIRSLARALGCHFAGCPNGDWPNDDFDTVVELTYHLSQRDLSRNLFWMKNVRMLHESFVPTP